MKLLTNLLLFTFLITVAGSCDPSEKRRNLPRYTGAGGEVLIVMDQSQWLGTPGDSLRSILEDFVPALPQREPKFSLLQFAPNEMSSLLKQHRNIIQITIGADGNDNPGVRVTKDKWSSHQLFFTVNAGSEEDFYQLLSTEFDRVVNIISQTEIDRLASRYKTNKNEAISELMHERFGISINLPDGCVKAKEAPDFVWIKRERSKFVGNTGHEITQGFVIYRYPYTGPEALEPENILAARDSVFKKYIPGPDKDTYMTTEHRYEPESQAITKNDRYTVLTQGLWRVENYFMGGPFRSLTTLSNDSQYVISVTGFVFAPKFDKREYVREVDAVLSTLRFD